jgi:hypothetical protein
MVKLVSNWFWIFLYDFEKGKSEIKNSPVEKDLKEAIYVLEQTYKHEQVSKIATTIRTLLE